MIRPVFGFLAFVSLAVACSPKISLEEDDEVGTDDGIIDEGPIPLRTNRDVDILFVIDNSASMGTAQRALADGIDPLFAVLGDPELRANYRIAITTTDSGNPQCSPGETTPENGAMVLSSCLTRLDEFVFDGIDDQALACQDICSLSDAELAIQPTTTDVDPNPTARRWLERIEHVANIPAATDMADAFRCFAPQGITGCGFESQLESMYLALDQASDETHPNYGFLRPGAILAIVIVSDETDCSHEPLFADIFSPDGNKVFWSDPSAALPTSAVCWNAGVRCTGDPSGYDECEPVNKDIDGNVDVPGTLAVLRPMKRYLDFVQELEEQQQELVPYREVIVASISGVGSDGSVFYADDLGDSQFQDEYGIGPGCTAGNLRAVPPVRERALVDDFTPGNMFSICEPDFTLAIEAIADQIRDQIRPACFWQCAADTNAATELLEPDCTVEQVVPGMDEEPLVECLRTGDGSYAIDPATADYVMPSDAVDVCYALRVDAAGLTSDPADDLSNECRDSNFNLEVAIARRTGVPAPGGTSIAAACLLSDFPQVECPNIGN